MTDGAGAADGCSNCDLDLSRAAAGRRSNADAGIRITDVL
jgi:hypothetical protein